VHQTAAATRSKGSFLAAPANARRIGLLNTMVFTHQPSHLLLLLVPLMPSVEWVVAILMELRGVPACEAAGRGNLNMPGSFLAPLRAVANSRYAAAGFTR
jgi:hypothetical protein